MFRVRSVFIASQTALFLLLSCCVAMAQTPAMVMSLHWTVNNTLTKGVSRVAANARGDVFFADPGKSEIVEVAAGTTTEIALLTNITVGGSGTAPDGVTVDSAGNVYVAAAYDSRVVRIPFVNGTYATNTSMSALKTANTLCTPGSQVPCVVATNWSQVSGYMETGDMAFDAAGDMFFVDISDGIGGTVNRIVEVTAGGTVNIVANNLPSVPSAQIASDAAGNLYYAEGQGATTGSLPSTYLYYIPANSVGVDANPDHLVAEQTDGCDLRSGRQPDRQRQRQLAHRGGAPAERRP